MDQPNHLPLLTAIVDIALHANGEAQWARREALQAQLNSGARLDSTKCEGLMAELNNLIDRGGVFAQWKETLTQLEYFSSEYLVKILAAAAASHPESADMSISYNIPSPEDDPGRYLAVWRSVDDKAQPVQDAGSIEDPKEDVSTLASYDPALLSCVNRILAENGYTVTDPRVIDELLDWVQHHIPGLDMAYETQPSTVSTQLIEALTHISKAFKNLDDRAEE